MESDQVFFEKLSDIFYHNIEKVNLKVNEETHQSTLSLTFYQKVKTEILDLEPNTPIEINACRTELLIADDFTRIKVWPMSLFQGGWAEGDPFEFVAHEEQHKLFRPLLEKKKIKMEKERAEQLELIQKEIIEGNIQMHSPIADLIEKMHLQGSKFKQQKDEPEYMEFK